MTAGQPGHRRRPRQHGRRSVPHRGQRGRDGNTADGSRGLVYRSGRPARVSLLGRNVLDPGGGGRRSHGDRPTRSPARTDAAGRRLRPGTARPRPGTPRHSQAAAEAAPEQGAAGGYPPEQAASGGYPPGKPPPADTRPDKAPPADTRPGKPPRADTRPAKAPPPDTRRASRPRPDSSRHNRPRLGPRRDKPPADSRRCRRCRRTPRRCRRSPPVSRRSPAWPLPPHRAGGAGGSPRWSRPRRSWRCSSAW